MKKSKQNSTQKESKQQIKPEIKQTSKVASLGVDYLEQPGNKAVLIALGLIGLVAFIVFKDYLLLEKVYLFTDIGNDTLQGYYPFITGDIDYLHKFGIPKWSFNGGMGQNIFPMFLLDPFNIFLYIAGKNNVMYGMAYKELAKILLTGFIFFRYLKIIKLSNYTAITGSLLLSFCGFMIVGGGWYVFSTEVFEFVLLLLSFELLFMKQKWYLFPLPIFLICISMPFNLYIYGVFLAFYAMLRLFQTKKFNAKNVFTIFSQMIGLGLLGILFSAPFSIEFIYQLLESPRGSGNTSLTHILSSAPVFGIADNIQLGSSVMRFFSSNLLGNGIVFKGWRNYLEAPLLYCGLPCLILMPQLFPFLEKRVRIAFIVIIAIWITPLIFPYFRNAFWLFTGDYYRGFAFFISFIFLYYSLQALEMIIQKGRINLIILIATIIALFALLHYPYFPDNEAVDHSILIFVSCMLVVYGILLYFISKRGSPAFLKYLFVIIIISELVYQTNLTVNERRALTSDQLSGKSGYNDYSVEAINYIKHTDGSFYRIDKTYGSSPAYYPSLNDGMVQDYHGTSSYNSFNQEYYIKYLQLMGVAKNGDELDSRFSRGLIRWPILESENCVKYILTKKRMEPIYDSICDSVTTFGDVKVYRNKLLIPFGFTYGSFIKERVFDSLATSEKQFLTMAACAIQDKDANKLTGLKELLLKDTIPLSTMTYERYRQDIKELSKDTLAIDKFGETLISGKIDLKEDKMMCMSVPFDGGWKLKVDGKPQDKIILNGGMTGIMLKKGPHMVEMVYDLRFFRTGLYLCLLGALIYAGLWLFMKKYEMRE